MKKLLTLSLIVFLASCGAEEKIDSSAYGKMKAELDSLKSVKADLSTKIVDLEAKIETIKPDSMVKKTAVSVTKPSIETFRHFISLQGTLESKNAVNVSPRMGGRVTNVKVKEGQKVSAGQTLATVDASVLYQQRKEMQSALELATTLFEKQKRLRDQNVGTEVDFLQAENQVKRIEKQIASMNAQIGMSAITSSISGVVDEVFVKVGETAAPGMPAFKIVNQNDVVVSVPVSDKYLGNIRKGQELTIIFPDLEDTTGGKVTFVSQSINPVNRTFDIEATINPKEKPSQIRANMMALVQINDQTIDSAMIVDKNMLKNSEKGAQILVAEQINGKWFSAAKNVKTGLDYAGRVVVLEGLSKDDQVITMGYQDLVPGTPLKIVK